MCTFVCVCVFMSVCVLCLCLCERVYACVRHNSHPVLAGSVDVSFASEQKFDRVTLTGLNAGDVCACE